MKIVINACHGGFRLSDSAKELYKERAGRDFNEHVDGRTCLDLVFVVESLGDDASDWCSRLRVVEIPDGVEWEICEYDGCEWVAEKHRVWEAS